MTKKILFSFLAVLLSVNALRAEEAKEKPQAPKKKIFVYAFVPLDDSGKYIYYSSVIPATIAKNIRMNGLFDSESTDETRPLLPANATDDEKKKYFDGMAGLQSGYAVTGYCEVTENPKVIVNGRNELILKTKIQVFDLSSRKFETLEFSSKEVGVILKDAIDEISAGIEEWIYQFEPNAGVEVAAETEPEAKEPPGPSPFLRAYSAFSRFTFGIEAGELFVLGEWADLYNWSLYVKPYFMFSIIPYMGLSLSYDYFSTDNEDLNDDSPRTYLEIHTVSLGVYGTYRFIKYIDVMASASVGVSVSKITIDNNSEESNPFSDPLGEKKSIDPSMDLGVSIGFHLSSVILRTGFNYKRYFYSDEHLHGVAVYGSLGYNF